MSHTATTDGGSGDRLSPAYSTCQLCGAEFDGPLACDDHVSEGDCPHASADKHTCHHCGDEFDHFRQWDAHMETCEVAKAHGFGGELFTEEFQDLLQAVEGYILNVE